MGKLQYVDDRNGYEFVSDKGYRYDLLEGMTFHGNTTSDIIFVLLSFDEQLSEKVDDEFVWYFYGAEFALRDRDKTEEMLEKQVRKYEERMNL